MNKKTSGGAPDWGAVHRVRVGHVRSLLRDRYGAVVPDDDAGNEDLRILLHCKANACKPENRVDRLIKEIEAMAPWMSSIKARTIAEQISAKPLKVTSDWLGKVLNVDADTRDRLAIWQIGAVDLDAAGRRERALQRRRERDRERKRKQRQCQPRAEWLAQHSREREKPWESLGISRRTYYRRLSAGRGTGLSAPVSEKPLWLAGSCADRPVPHNQGEIDEGEASTHCGLVDPQRRLGRFAGQGEQAEQDLSGFAAEVVHGQGGQGSGLQAAGYCCHPAIRRAPVRSFAEAEQDHGVRTEAAHYCDTGRQF
jgi:hypothetical protein